jgi:hypothetical protein
MPLLSIKIEKIEKIAGERQNWCLLPLCFRKDVEIWQQIRGAGSYHEEYSSVMMDMKPDL